MVSFTVESPLMPNILLVEDDAVQVAAFAHVVRQAGVISFASTMADAIRMIQEPRFDLIILDLSLPDSTPTQMLERVREIHGHVPVIVLTSSSDEETLAAVSRTCWPIVRKDAPQALIQLREAIANSLEFGDLRDQSVNADHLTGIANTLEAIKAEQTAQRKLIAEIVLAIAGDPPSLDGEKVRREGLAEIVKRHERYIVMATTSGAACTWKIAAAIGSAAMVAFGAVTHALYTLWLSHAGKQ